MDDVARTLDTRGLRESSLDGVRFYATCGVCFSEAAVTILQKAFSVLVVVLMATGLSYDNWFAWRNSGTLHYTEMIKNIPVSYQTSQILNASSTPPRATTICKLTSLRGAEPTAQGHSGHRKHLHYRNLNVNGTSSISIPPPPSISNIDNSKTGTSSLIEWKLIEEVLCCAVPPYPLRENVLYSRKWKQRLSQ